MSVQFSTRNQNKVEHETNKMTVGKRCEHQSVSESFGSVRRQSGALQFIGYQAVNAFDIVTQPMIVRAVNSFEWTHWRQYNGSDIVLCKLHMWLVKCRYFAITIYFTAILVCNFSVTCRYVLMVHIFVGPGKSQ